MEGDVDRRCHRRSRIAQAEEEEDIGSWTRQKRARVLAEHSAQSGPSIGMTAEAAQHAKKKRLGVHFSHSRIVLFEGTQ